MKKIAIVYFSKTGSTEQLVHSFIKGIEGVKNSENTKKVKATEKPVEILPHQIQPSEIIDGRFDNAELFAKLREADAIAFATPTYMGGVSAQFKAFADASSCEWLAQNWADKLAVGLTCGTGLNGDQSATLQYLFILASQHGMIWVGLDRHYQDNSGLNRLGCQMGVVAQTNYQDETDNNSMNASIHPIDLATAEYLGKRLVRILARIKRH